MEVSGLPKLKGSALAHAAPGTLIAISPFPGPFCQAKLRFFLIGRIKVSGPGQYLLASVLARPFKTAQEDTWLIEAAMSGRGFLSGLLFNKKRRLTELALIGSAAKPYDVSVGKATIPPLLRTEIASDKAFFVIR